MLLIKQQKWRFVSIMSNHFFCRYFRYFRWFEFSSCFESHVLWSL